MPVDKKWRPLLVVFRAERGGEYDNRETLREGRGRGSGL